MKERLEEGGFGTLHSTVPQRGMVQLHVFIYFLATVVIISILPISITVYTRLALYRHVKDRIDMTFGSQPLLLSPDFTVFLSQKSIFMTSVVLILMDMFIDIIRASVTLEQGAIFIRIKDSCPRKENVFFGIVKGAFQGQRRPAHKQDTKKGGGRKWQEFLTKMPSFHSFLPSLILLWTIYCLTNWSISSVACTFKRISLKL